jgi:hypothetical protein
LIRTKDIKFFQIPTSFHVVLLCYGNSLYLNLSLLRRVQQNSQPLNLYLFLYLYPRILNEFTLDLPVKTYTNGATPIAGLQSGGKQNNLKL